MSAHEVNYLDSPGLTLYDTLLKQYISQEQAISYKTILFSADNSTIYFYKKVNATLSDTPDFTIVNGTALTLNGTNKNGSSASIYAPTSAGTNGQVLISNGSGAPSWGNVSISQYVPTYNSQSRSLVFTKTSS